MGIWFREVGLRVRVKVRFIGYKFCTKVVDNEMYPKVL